jgi:hypothetical protein
MSYNQSQVDSERVRSPFSTAITWYKYYVHKLTRNSISRYTEPRHWKDLLLIHWSDAGERTVSHRIPILYYLQDVLDGIETRLYGLQII